MQSLLKILLLLLTIQQSFNSVVKTVSSHSWSVIQTTENPQNPLDYPSATQSLYVIDHQAESPAEITNRVLHLQPTIERKYEPYRSSPPEYVIERWLITYITFEVLIEHSLTIQKLIFPFHSFL